MPQSVYWQGSVLLPSLDRDPMEVEDCADQVSLPPYLVSARRELNNPVQKSDGVTYQDDDRNPNNDGEQDVYSKRDEDRSPQRGIHLFAILMFLPSL